MGKDVLSKIDGKWVCKFYFVIFVFFKFVIFEDLLHYTSYLLLGFVILFYLPCFPVDFSIYIVILILLQFLRNYI